jgi:hypothetical protein
MSAAACPEVYVSKPAIASTAAVHPAHGGILPRGLAAARGRYAACERPGRQGRAVNVLLLGSQSPLKDEYSSEDEPSSKRQTPTSPSPSSSVPPCRAQ